MSFDWTTFVFEIVNFLLLLWILQRVLYRPLREGIERRREELAREHGRAAAERDAARAQREEAQARLAEIEHLRETIVADAREQAAKEEARILGQARQDAVAERERVQRTLERERIEELEWLRETTADGAAEIAGRLLKELLPESADSVLTKALVVSLGEHRDTLKKESIAIAGPSGRLTVELSVPRPPSEEALHSLRQALTQVCAVAFDLVVREDADLLAGPVLRIGDRVLDASVAGHLAVLRDRVRELVEEETASG